MNEKIKPVHIIAVLLFDKIVGFSIIIMARTIGITVTPVHNANRK